MNKFTLKFLLSGELKKINRVIDYKIAKGLSYKRESRRHKMILRQLGHLREDRGVFAFI